MPKKNISVSLSHGFSYLPWDSLARAERIREIVRYAQRHCGRAVTVNLKPEMELQLHQQEQPMRTVSKRMNTELNRLDLRQLPVLMVLEATRPDGRLHLHGVYLEAGYSNHRIQQAMRRAAGYIEGRRGSRQFNSKPVYAADGWMNYISKDCRWTQRNLRSASEERLWWVSHPMTRIVREEYEALRLGRKKAANHNNPMLVAS